MPRRKSADSRQHMYHVRLNDAEYEKASTLAAAVRRSVAYVLRSHLNGITSLKPAAPPVAAFDMQAIRELRRIGSNINQLVRELYRHDRQNVTAEEMIKIDKELMRLVALVYLGESARDLMTERFSTWFAQTKMPTDRPTKP